jgi:hypothetical protein
MNAPRRKPENNETNAARQARLRERRKAAGFKRVSVWLSPDQVDSLERLGGEPWLGTRVKQLLESAARPPVAKQVALFVVPDPDPEKRGICAFEAARVEPDQNSGQPTNSKAALFQDAERLRAQGLSWGAIARQWNEQGRRTGAGTLYVGHNIARDYRRWQKGGVGE